MPKDTLIQITEKGIHYFNVSQTRRVLVEKNNVVDTTNELILEMLEHMSDERSAFMSYFTKKHDVIRLMLAERLLKSEIYYGGPPIYNITSL